MSRPYDHVKRAVDIIVSLVLLVVTAPLMAAVAVAILVTMGRPVMFRQRRAGRYGQPFTLVKFRSMRPGDPNAGTLGNVATDGERLTRLGRVLRATSLDELPTLWHVLRGEMSLVGPRPAIPSEVATYTYEQLGRLHAIPGITGLQQVSGRSNLDFKRWVELDLQYISEQSIWKDIEILIRTIPAVLFSRGAY